MKKLVSDLHVEGKRVLVRVDFNVPHKGDVISDDNRVRAAVPTIAQLINSGAKVILMSHLGKIKWGKVDDEEIANEKKKNDLRIVLPVLKEHIEAAVGHEVNISFSEDTRGEGLANAAAALNNGDILLVQNTRYEKGETKNNPELAAEWASLCDAYVMDAFGSAHRAHCSTVGIPEVLNADGRETAVGYLVEKEINGLGRCVDCPEEGRPYIAILGGSKVSDKIQVIDSLLSKCDKILIGGGMSYTFQAALGHTVGNSLFEADQVEYASRCLESGKIVLPIDTKISDAIENHGEISIVSGDIPDGQMGLDIGPETENLFRNEINNARTIFWNGPMGVFESEEFASGTIAVCSACADATDNGAFSVIGGGDSASAAKQFGYAQRFSHVSTGGGASLELIQYNGHLPGIDVIQDN